MTNAERIQSLENRVTLMAETIKELIAHKTVVERHVGTLCRATRRALNDNKVLRIENHDLKSKILEADRVASGLIEKYRVEVLQ
jgi:regulator of replication initiation timing